jgi:hypothetical protein
MYVDCFQPFHERSFGLDQLAVVFIALNRAIRLAIQLWITRAKVTQSIPFAELIARNDDAPSTRFVPELPSLGSNFFEWHNFIHGEEAPPQINIPQFA